MPKHLFAAPRHLPRTFAHPLHVSRCQKILQEQGGTPGRIGAKKENCCILGAFTRDKPTHSDSFRDPMELFNKNREKKNHVSRLCVQSS
jgi:hypothetical protein